MTEELNKYCQELQRVGIEYRVMEHPHLTEVAEVQKYLGEDLSGSGQTLLMKAGKEFVAIVKRGNVRLDSAMLKKYLKVSNLRMATEEEFSTLTDVPVGTTRIYNPNIRTILDKSVFNSEFINGGTGSFEVTFKYKSEDLKKIPGVELAEVTESGRRRIFAGMRPTGRLHLGNYLGSAKGMLALQEDPKFDTIYMVVDLHGITTPYDKDHYQEGIKSVLKDYLAIGLDPNKSILTVQSRVPEHVELAYLLSSVTTIAKMTHLPTFKEKVKQYPEHSTMALLNYPVLMAADIMIYKGELVPVGLDQEPHIEVTREVARRMNEEYGTNFPEPQRFATPGSYVPSLTGEGKMSKSVEGSYIALTDDLQTIKSKLAKTPTDAGGPGDVPKEGSVANLFKFVELFKPERLEYYGQLYHQGKLRYSEMKEDLARAIYEEIKPIQERREKITDEYVEQVTEEGAEKARKIARETLQEVKKKMGLIS
jgi:tryptophanyl-tRNA synthetase